MKKADIGLVGLAVMGENLVMNMESRGFTVAVYNRTTDKVKNFVEGRAAGKNIIGTYSLEELAAWMDVNGEAIHGAKCWRRFAEGPVHAAEGQFQDGKEVAYTSKDYRFTVNHGAIYAMCLKCPEDGEFMVESLRGAVNHNLPVFQGIIRDVKILGYDGAMTWHQDAEGLHVSAPGLSSQYPVTIRAELE